MYHAALIGVSGYGENHYLALKNEVENGLAEITAATVINQDEEKEKCDWLRSRGTKLFTDYREMLSHFQDKIDLCFIPTGISMHAEMSIAAMRSGANVYVEKPVTATVQDLRDIQRVSQETGKFVAVGYQYIYQPDIHGIKQFLLDGRLGRLNVMKGHATAFRNSTYYARNNWAGKLRANGAWVLDSPFNNAHAHYLNLLCFFAGTQFDKAAEIKTVQAELYRGNAVENADTICLRAGTGTGSGVPICFYATHACSVNHAPVLVAVGEKGRLTLDIAKPDILVELNDGTNYTLPRTSVKEHNTHLFNALRKRLVDPSGFICDLGIAGSQTLCCNGAYESSAIQTVPGSFKSEVENADGSTHVEIAEIENIIDRAFAEEKLFSELGVSWAKPGRPFDMSGYSEFCGGRSAESSENKGKA